jgi:hypothetical protein
VTSTVRVDGVIAVGPVCISGKQVADARKELKAWVHTYKTEEICNDCLAHFSNRPKRAPCANCGGTNITTVGRRYANGSDIDMQIDELVADWTVVRDSTYVLRRYHPDKLGDVIVASVARAGRGSTVQNMLRRLLMAPGCVLIALGIR